MTESVVYVPLSEETLSFVEKFKKADEDIDTFLRRLLEEKIYQKDIEIVQLEKMKELWDNKSDEAWNNL